MRTDSVLMVLGIATVAAGTYYVLDSCITRPEPTLAQVAPQQPVVFTQSDAARDKTGSDRQP